MNREAMLKDLADWIESLKEAARTDEAISISWFGETKNYPFSIIGGWEQGFDETMADVMCISKADPCYAMCVKVAINDGPYAYTDFDIMNMPFDEEGMVDDTCVALEWEDDSYEAAMFFLGEWERIMKEHGEAI